MKLIGTPEQKFEFCIQIFKNKERVSGDQTLFDVLPEVLKILKKFFRIGDLRIRPDVMEFDPEGFWGCDINIFINCENDVDGDELYQALKSSNFDVGVAVFKNRITNESRRISDRVLGDTNPNALSETEFREQVKSLFSPVKFEILPIEDSWVATSGETKIAYKPNEHIWVVENEKRTGTGATLMEAVELLSPDE